MQTKWFEIADFFLFLFFKKKKKMKHNQLTIPLNKLPDNSQNWIGNKMIASHCQGNAFGFHQTVIKLSNAVGSFPIRQKTKICTQ